MNIRTLYYLVLHDWNDFRRNIALWIMVIVPVILSFFIVRTGTTAGAGPADTVPMWVLFAQSMISIMTMVLNFVDEKEKRTLEALIVTTATYRGVALSKVLFVFVLGILGQLLVLLINGGFVGNVPALLGLVLLGGAVFVLIGLLISLFAETQRNGSAMASAIMVLLFLSGVVYQAFGPLQEVLRFLPSVLSIRLIGAAMRNQSLDQVELLTMFGWLILLLVVVEIKIRMELRK